MHLGPNESLSDFLNVWKDLQRLSDIWLSEFWAIGSRFEDLILLPFISTY